MTRNNDLIFSSEELDAKVKEQCRGCKYWHEDYMDDEGRVWVPLCDLFHGSGLEYPCGVKEPITLGSKTIMLEKYVSLSQQAENINTTESYKELVETIKSMTYEEMFQLFYDSETTLQVMLREGNKYPGIKVSVERIVELGNLYLQLEKAQYFRVKYTWEASRDRKERKINEDSFPPKLFLLGGKQ